VVVENSRHIELEAAPAHVFVVGLDDFNLRFIQRVKNAERYRISRLLDQAEIASARQFDLPALLDKARRQLAQADGGVDAIVGYWDFPTQLMMPILRSELGLRGPSLESVLRCEHKYWSRLLQREAAPAHVPRFALVDPFDERAAERLHLPFPFWIKPVKAHSSKLGFLVGNRRQLDSALDKIRRGIDYFAKPFDHILEHARLPEEIAGIKGRYCIAEEIISAGRQCTLEGYVIGGQVEIYGIVGSVRGPNRSSFERYQYPYLPPGDVQGRMKQVAADVIARTGLDDSPFNVEFFYGKEDDSLHLLEINTRISKSHSPLFEAVEGSSNHQVMLEVALGEKPDYPAHQGRHKVAAKFMLRHYGDDDDAIVVDAPDEEQVARAEQRFPGTYIQLHARPGMRLGDFHHKDSYSYELAEIFMGAESYDELMENYRRCIEQLPFVISREGD